jgi:hypothetical protein
MRSAFDQWSPTSCPDGRRRVGGCMLDLLAEARDLIKTLAFAAECVVGEQEHGLGSSGVQDSGTSRVHVSALH